jgi:hypothetical protein
MVFSKAGNELFNASNAGTLNSCTIPFIPGIQHAVATSTSHLDLHCWHLHFCHCSPTAIEGAIKHGLTLEPSAIPHNPLCAGCLASKHHRDPFPPSQSTTSELLELVHTDLHDPVAVVSGAGKLYWALFIDDFP